MRQTPRGRLHLLNIGVTDSMFTSTRAKYLAQEAEREKRMEVQRAARLAMQVAGMPLPVENAITSDVRIAKKWTEATE